MKTLIWKESGKPSGSNRVMRGGGWINGAGSLRAGNRYRYEPGYRGGYFGFRCVRLLETSNVKEETDLEKE